MEEDNWVKYPEDWVQEICTKSDKWDKLSEAIDSIKKHKSSNTEADAMYYHITVGEAALTIYNEGK